MRIRPPNDDKTKESVKRPREYSEGCTPAKAAISGYQLLRRLL
jgi:hypothetical protein